MAGLPPDNRGPILFMVMLAIAAFIAVAGGLSDTPVEDSPDPTQPTSTPSDGERHDPPGHSGEHGGDHQQRQAAFELPGGGRRIFGNGRFLVAYYGTAGTGALGVLGETPPGEMQRRVERAARPFRRAGEHLQIVYELIVTIADRGPGRDGDYSHDVPRAKVQRYIDAARRHDAILLLDLQPGRSAFPAVARRWAWALEHPWVGLALDPEWRVDPHQVPGGQIGRVNASEVNGTSAWLDRLTAQRGLPEKLFLLHQFRTSMVNHIERVRDRPHLATVLHADGFGNRRQKIATYRAIARPQQFTMGFKLFYDEDVHRFDAAGVRRIRPRVSFVSYQ